MGISRDPDKKLRPRKYEAGHLSAKKEAHIYHLLPEYAGLLSPSRGPFTRTVKNFSLQPIHGAREQHLAEAHTNGAAVQSLSRVQEGCGTTLLPKTALRRPKA